MMCPQAISTGILPWSPRACIRLRTINVTEFFRSLRTSSPMGRGIEYASPALKHSCTPVLFSNSTFHVKPRHDPYH